MSVIPFTRISSRPDAWDTAELKDILSGVGPYLAARKGGWDLAATEAGDPQFYLLDAPPHEDCILCISRLGRLYVMEDGAGRILYEDTSLAPLAEQARKYLRAKQTRLVARITVLWCALRSTFEEKVEAVLVEGEEMLMHFAPQLAALA
jgi:hypothetical protein